jgi:DNA primase
VRTLMDTKVPMFEFEIDQRLKGFDLTTVEGRAGALRTAAPIVAEIRDGALRSGYTRVLARRLGLDLPEVERAVRSAARTQGGSGDRIEAPASGESPGPEEPQLRVTLASLPASAALERDALMGFLQFGHRIDPELLTRALGLTFQHPALDAVRQSIVASDMSRPGWAADAVTAVREPYRSLGAELLTAAFPARDDEHAVMSTTSLARGLLMRALDAEKSELLRSIQRVAPDSEEGRAVRLRLRQLDLERRAAQEAE